MMNWEGGVLPGPGTERGDSAGRTRSLGACERKSEVAQSCPTLSDPMDCSLPNPGPRWGTETQRIAGQADGL